MKGMFDHGGNVFGIARALGISPGDILDFSASINPLGSAPGVKEAVAAAFDRIVHYPDSDCIELQEALARYHGVASDTICVANGSTELIYLLPRLMAGKRALLIAPAFSEYAKALRMAGWESESFVLSGDGGFPLSTAALGMELAKGYDLLFLCNPGNPTGRLYSLAEVAEIIGLCASAGTFLVLDEAFMDFCEEESAKHLLTRGEGGVVLRSMTKFFAIPGLRLGYAIASPQVTARLAALREPWSVNALAQAAGVASLVATEYISATKEYVARERAALFEGLAGMPGLFPYPSAANYNLVELQNGLSARHLREGLLEKRILIRDCANFRGLDKRYFRVAVRTRAENGRLLAALGEILGKSA